MMNRFVNGSKVNLTIKADNENTKGTCPSKDGGVAL